jgi:uncharacterized protein YbaP (TraB family)
MSQSEVARLRQQIAEEYQAASRLFCEFTETARHDFITKRQEHVASYFEQLTQHVSPDEAMRILIQASGERKT